MAFIKENETLPMGGGILMPALQHNWKVSFPNIDDKHSEVLTRQAVSLKLNIVKDDLELFFEQPLHHSDFLSAVKLMANHRFQQVLIEFMDGHSKTHSMYLCKVYFNDHEFVLDYSETGAVLHKLKFSSVKE